MRYELSIIVPTRNDASTLDHVLNDLNATLVESGLSAEVLIVDDGSTDGTLEIAEKAVAVHPMLHAQVLSISRPGRGFGSLARFGLAYASGRYGVFLAADGSDPAEQLPHMLKRLREGAQLVICSRYDGPNPGEGVSRRFQLYQKVYRFSIKTLLGEKLIDSTSGFRAFDRRFVQALGLSSNHYSICPEMTFKTLLIDGTIDYVVDHPRELTDGIGTEKFKLRHELVGYAGVLARAGVHRAGVSWF